jgi:hypothetical protein
MEQIGLEDKLDCFSRAHGDSRAMALLAYEILKSDTPPWGLPHTKQMNSKIGLGALLMGTRWRVSTQ